MHLRSCRLIVGHSVGLLLQSLGPVAANDAPYWQPNASNQGTEARMEDRLAHIRPPVRGVDDPFLMPIEDVFLLPGVFFGSGMADGGDGEGGARDAHGRRRSRSRWSWLNTPGCRNQH